jgi:hypothetical protein
MAAWGDPEGPATEGSGESLSGETALPGGHRIVFNPEGWQALLHDPRVVEAIAKRAAHIAETANGLVGLSPATKTRLSVESDGKPAYDYVVQDDPSTKRARARVKPASILGSVDDAVNSTLLKSLEG